MQRFANFLALHRAKNMQFCVCLCFLWISLLYLGSSVVFPNSASVYIRLSSVAVFFFSSYILLFLHSYIFNV